MKVKQLIENLSKFDENLDVWVCDEIEGNDSPLLSLEESETPIDSCNPKPRKAMLLLRW